MTEILVSDTETTGLNGNTDKVVDFGFCWLSWPFDHDKAIKPPESHYIHPGLVPISPEARATHHIVLSDLDGAPDWGVAPSLVSDYAERMLGTSDDGAPRRFDYAAFHNSRFDCRWVKPHILGESPVIDTLRCARNLWPDAPTHSNQGLRYFLEDTGNLFSPVPMDRAIADNAHRAGPDAYVTAHILRAMLNFMWCADHNGRTFGEMGYSDISGMADVSKIHIQLLYEWSSRATLLTKVSFGNKYKGSLWKNVDKGYLSWCLKNVTDNPDVQYTAQHYLNLANGVGSPHDR
jgi:exodeoxyribonuclease X